MRYIIFIIFMLFSALLFGDTWKQNSWVGGGGQKFWEDSTKYWEDFNIENAGNLSLLPKDTCLWIELVNFPNTQRVYSIFQVSPDTLYASTGNTKGYTFKTTDGGVTWDSIFRGGNWLTARNVFKNGAVYITLENEPGYAYLLKFTPNEQGEEGTNRLDGANAAYSLLRTPNYWFIGTGDNVASIYRSEEVGSVISPIANLGDKQVLSLLETYDGTLYAGTGWNNGIVAKSTDNGNTWIETSDLPGAKSVYCLTQGGDSAIYAGTDTSGIIYKTINGGNNWIECGDLALAIKVRSLIYVPEIQSLVAGCECKDDTARVFISIDNGENWISLDAMPGASIPYCLLYTYNGSLLVGTDYNGTIFKTSGFDTATAGWFVSSIYNTGTGNRSVKYDTIRWDATYNGQEIIVKVRTFNDTVGWSDTIPWSDCPPCTNGQLLSSLSSVRDSMQFIQYKLEFATQNPFLTPIFHEININYSLDTTRPKIVSAYAQGDEEFIPPDTIIPKDKIIITFSKPIDTFTIDSSNIDSLLKLSGGHTWVDSFGQITSAVWDSSCKILTITLGKNGWSRWVNVGDTIYPQSYLNDSIADRWGNKCVSFCVIEGSFGPCIDSIVAYDGEDSLEYIDNDDYVSFYFSKRTNKPKIDANNIDSILHIPNHTWLDGLGELRGDSCIWDEYGFTLTCSLKTDSLRPTIAIGDTVFPPDSVIWDKFERGYVALPAIIQGGFGVYGPIIDSAIAYEGDPQEVGIGDGDFVFIYFNKLIKEISWYLGGIDTILIPVANGDTHTWEPETLRCYVQQLERVDLQGIPYTLLYIYVKKYGVEEKEIQITDCKFQNYPTLFPKGTWIEFQIPTKEHMLSRLGSIQHSAIEVGDTIYPNPKIIKDLENRNAKGFVVLKGSFQKLKDSNIEFLACEKISHSNKQKIEKIESKVKVCIKIYNLGGQLVRTLINEQLRPGKYKIYWDGLDEEKREVKSGIYFCKLEIGKKVFTNKLIKLQ